MWPKAYRDYQRDRSLIKYQVTPGKGIIGCEMHDLNGWGSTWHGHISTPPSKQEAQARDIDTETT